MPEVELLAPCIAGNKPGLGKFGNICDHHSRIWTLWRQADSQGALMLGMPCSGLARPQLAFVDESCAAKFKLWNMIELPFASVRLEQQRDARVLRVLRLCVHCDTV